MIKRAPEMNLAGLLSLMMQEPGTLPDQSDSYTGYARFALLNLLRLLGYGRGDKILLPAYICDVVLLPFAELGIEPVYYGITADLQVDWESVQILPGTRAFLSVNYFGVSQDYAAIAEFCASKDLVWLNDNAHGFASCLDDKRLEEFGDFSFTSFRKVIGSLNGGRVRINNSRFLSLKGELDRLNGSAPGEARLRFFLAATLRTMGLRLRALPDFSDPRGFCEDDIKGYGLDELARKHLGQSNEGTIRERRRVLYLAVEEFLLASGCRSMAPIPGLLREGNSPLVLPVVAADGDAWSELLHQGRLHGLDLHTWPSLPGPVLENNSCGAAELWGRMLFLPLHQDLQADRYLPLLQKVIDAV